MLSYCLSSPSYGDSDSEEEDEDDDGASDSEDSDAGSVPIYSASGRNPSATHGMKLRHRANAATISREYTDLPVEDVLQAAAMTMAAQRLLTTAPHEPQAGAHGARSRPLDRRNFQELELELIQSHMTQKPVLREISRLKEKVV